MSTVQHGATITRTNTDLVLDPRYGPAVREVWRGDKNGLLALAASYAAVGIRAEYSDNEGIGVLTLTLPQGNDPSVAEVPSDTWEIISEVDNQSIWNNKRVVQQAESAGASSSLGTAGTIAYWRQRAQNALVGKYAIAGTGPVEYLEFNEGSKEPLTADDAGFSASLDPFLRKLYVKLLRGEDSYEFRRITLRLNRVVSSNYADRAVLDPIEKIYTSNALRVTFAVPDAVFRLLPADPAPTLTPPDTAWGWRLRQDGYQVVLSTNKVQETKDWIFGAHDTDLYELVS